MTDHESMINEYNLVKRNALAVVVVTAGLLAVGEYKPTEANAIPVPVNPATYTPKKGETPVDFTDPTVTAAIDKMNIDPIRTTLWAGDVLNYPGYEIMSGRQGPDSETRPGVLRKKGVLVARLNLDWTSPYMDLVGDATQTISLQAKKPGKRNKFKTIGQPARWAYGLNEAVQLYMHSGYPDRVEIPLDVSENTLKRYRSGEVRLKSTYNWNFNENQTFRKYLTVNPQGQDEYTEVLPNDGRPIPDEYKGTREVNYSKPKPTKDIIVRK